MKLNLTNQMPVAVAFFVLVFLLAPLVSLAQVGSLRVIVGGRELPANVRAELRGARTMLPVAPIARELGYEVKFDPQTESVKVRRPGAEAEFVKQSGEVRENGVTVTAVPDTIDIVFSSNPDTLLLPAEALAPLLNVALIIDKQKNLVQINSRDARSETVSSAKSKYAVGDLSYNYSFNSTNGFFYQNLNVSSAGRIGDNTFQFNTNFSGGGNYRFINFYNGNFTLQKPSGAQFQAGDLTTSLGTETTLLNTLVRGVSYTRPMLGARGKLSVYGGRSFDGVVQQFGEFVVPRRTPAVPFNTTIFGSRMTFHPFQPKPKTVATKDLNFSAGAVWYNGSHNKGLMIDAAARYTTKHLRLEAELAAGNFDFQTSDFRQVKGFGTGMILSGSYQPWNFLTMQARYERFSPNFSNPTRTIQYTNRETKSIGFSVQPFRNLTFGANASVSDNRNPILSFRQFPNGYKTETYGANFGYDPNFKLLPRFHVNITKIKTPVFGNLTFINSNFSRDYKNFRPSLSYLMTQGNGNTNHSIILGASVRAGKLGQFQGQYGFTLSKTPFLREEDVRCRLEPENCPFVFVPKLGYTNRNAIVDWNPDKLFFKVLRFTVGAGYIQNTEKSGLQLRTTVNLNLPYRQNLQFSYYKTDYGTDLRFSLSGPLAFWKPKNRLNEIVTDEALLTESTIQGRVYLDENGNRQFDAGVDSGMPDVRVTLNNGRQIVTDASGIYTFDRVSPGDNRLTVNIEDIRANLVSANGLEQTITVLPRTIVNTAFRLVRSGTLSGRVWHDANGNGKCDENEGLADIHVLSSTGRDTYTDADGTFLLSELPPGEQTIFIDRRYQPEDLTISDLSARAAVQSGLETKNVAFVFKTKPRAVKEINFGAKSK